MFGKNKKQPPPQQIQQYSDEQSEPLIEEVDPDYEPTDKQVKEYALDVLGMKFPEDQNLMYLAREGLKAPIPPNWVPYQSRDGQIYYKHKITQQKIYDHPTDIEYKKKYDQQKEKMARKNLKSIGLKQQQQLSGGLGGLGGLGMAPLGRAGGMAPFASNALPTPGISNLSNLSSQTHQLDNESSMTYGVDETTLQRYQQQLEEYQQDQERSWKTFERQIKEEHQSKMKKYKKQFQEELQSIKNGIGKNKNLTPSMLQENLEEQKKKIQKTIEESNSQTLRRELKLIEKQEQENKLQEYIGIFQQDHKIKLRKAEEELEAVFRQKSAKLDEKIIKYEEKQEENRRKRREALLRYQEELEGLDMSVDSSSENHPHNNSSVLSKQNKQLQNMLKNAIKNQLDNIQKSYKKKLDAKQQELQHSISEMKKILGIDKSQYFVTLALKKQKLKKLSQDKLQSNKNKNLQQIELQFEQRFQQDAKELQKKLEREFEGKCQKNKIEKDQKQVKQKQNIERLYKQKLYRDVESLYQGCNLQRNMYEKDMNKKLSEIRMKYIEEINGSIKSRENLNSQRNNNLANRFLLEEKQHQISNKEQLIKNLQKQLELETRQLKMVSLDRQISKSIEGENDKKQEKVDRILKQKMKELGILHRFQENNPELIKMRKTLGKYSQKYKSDKKILSQIMQKVQQTSIYTFVNGSNGSMGNIIKIYNEDIRKMRENQGTIYEIQRLIRNVEDQLQDGQQGNLGKLKDYVSLNQYKQINMRKELGIYPGIEGGTQKVSSNLLGLGLQQMKQTTNLGKNHNSGYSNGQINIDSALREHSKFLSTVKNQLNRKLYQVRYQTRY